ncbi:unnamed protein product [Schistocephalus solidus]|uniref:Uncharacterized protein n=1 Tax=Schistocephalus solidus TaxID=70667 RepID=A0A3P7F211_SCHSO|nr:unnamed protein product [Schistocephalus solidus]
MPHRHGCWPSSYFRSILWVVFGSIRERLTTRGASNRNRNGTSRPETSALQG